MAFTKRCFSSVEALRRLTPQVLRDLVALFPNYVAARQLVLPVMAAEDNLDFAGIRDALMAGNVPGELDDILYLSSLLGNSRGWAMVESQASEDGRTLPPMPAQLTYVDMAIVAATQEWPKHKASLERANARARVHSRSSYVYYAPALDPRAKYRATTDARIKETRDELAAYFIQQGLVEDSRHGRATEVIPYDFDKEVWFLIRYPGKQSRHSGCNRKGDWKSYVFNPEQYDAVAYNKVYGDLRMNTKRKRDHTKYRIVFGHLLFGEANVFRPKGQVVTLDPLLGDHAADLFGCDDVPGLGMIGPIEITYDTWGMPPRQYTEKALDGSTLLTGNKYGTRVLPSGALSVGKVVLTYRLDQMTRFGRLTLQVGNRVNFERDGDSVVVEDWLRRRGFVKSFVKVEGHEPIDLDEDRAIAVGE